MRCSAVVRGLVVALCASVSLLAVPGTARADADGAKKYLAEAKQQIADKDLDAAESSLALAEAELDGADAATKEAVAKEIASAKQAIAAGKMAEEKPRIVGNMKNYLGQAKTYLTSRPGDAKHYLEQAEAVLKEPEAAALSAEERAAYEKEIATYRKVVNAGMAKEAFAQIEPKLAEIEAAAPKAIETARNPDPNMSGTQSSELRDFESMLSGIERYQRDLPADDAKTKSINDKLAKITSDYQAASSEGRAVAFEQKMRQYWTEEAERSFANWQEELKNPAPTWDEYRKESSESMRGLRVPKAVEAHRRANYWLKNIEENEDYKAVKDHPKVKALVQDIQTQRDAAKAELLKRTESILADAEKAKIDKDQAQELGFFKNTIESVLDQGPEAQPLQARAQAMVDKYEQGAAAEESAKADLLKKMTEEAEKNWPKIAAAYANVPDGYSMDPASASKGQLYSFKDADNRGGREYDYGGQFDAIFPVNGVPVAVKLDPAVAKAANETCAATGYRLDDFDECVIEITGTGNVQQQEWNQVLNQWIATFLHKNVPVGRIVAAKSGPVAVAIGTDGKATALAAGEGGAVETSAVSGVSTEVSSSVAVVGGSSAAAVWGWRILYLIVGLGAGALVLTKAKFAPVASLPQAGQVETAIGANMGIVGIVVAVLGLWWLLSGLVYRDLLPALALTAAGAYLALDLLKGRGVVKEQQASSLAGVAVPIGLACIALTVLHLIVGGWPLL